MMQDKSLAFVNYVEDELIASTELLSDHYHVDGVDLGVYARGLFWIRWACWTKIQMLLLDDCDGGGCLLDLDIVCLLIMAMLDILF